MWYIGEKLNQENSFGILQCNGSAFHWVLPCSLTQELQVRNNQTESAAELTEAGLGSVGASENHGRCPSPPFQTERKKSDTKRLDASREIERAKEVP